jgi:hypothetical protein
MKAGLHSHGGVPVVAPADGHVVLEGPQ